jgi:hypothetical protein
MIWDENPLREKDFSLVQNVHTGSEIDTASYRVGTVLLWRE